MTSPLAFLRDHSAYRRLWLATSISELGSMVSRIAFILLVHERAKEHGEAPEAWVALVMALETLPMIVVGPIAGAFVDRSDRRALLIAANLVQLVLLALVPFVARSEAVWALFALAMVISAIGTVFLPGRQSAVPDLVGVERAGEANAISSTTASLNLIVAPLIAGSLIAGFGKDWCFWFDAATFFIAALLLIRVRLPRRASSASNVARIVGETLSGLRYVARDPVLFYMHATFLLGWIFIGVWFPIVPTFLERFVGVDPDVWMPRTWLAFGLGGVLGGLTGERLGRRFGMGRMVVLILFLEPLTIGAYFFAASITLVMALSFWWGALAFAFVVQETTVLHEDVPQELHGRVFGLHMPLQALGMLVATLFVFEVGGRIDARALLLGSGVVYLVASTVATIAWRGGALLWKRNGVR